MYKLLAIAVFAILTSLSITTGLSPVNLFDKGDTLKVIKPKAGHATEARVIAHLLKQYHYRKLLLSDSISSDIFDNYFLSLDPNKAYFFHADIKKFETTRYALDNQIPNGDLDFAYHVFELYRKRALERMDYVFQLLETEFDFTKDESYQFDRSDAPWPKTKKERNEIWRKIIKNQAINYKLSGNEWNKTAELLTKRYQRIQKAISQYNSDDVFQSYMNAFTSTYDPHTNYFSPPSAENFHIEMGLSLEGIGARLMQNLDYTQIADIIPGGPAYKSKAILKDDKIIAVAQGDNGKWTDVIGWRLDDVVAKIRGPKGTIVRLQILKASKGINALPDTIRLVRDKIKLESQASKAEIIPITQGNTTYQLGIITVPAFYLNFKELNAGIEDYRSTTRDVKKLIKELQQENIDGLLIDLRYNGGGSLQEAIDMTGLFIPDGPVVQVKNTNRSVKQMTDQDGGKVFYDGPLAIMVNRASASASEIFSGAIQDYQRGIIIGEGTFGKGTVQNIIDLNRHIPNPKTKPGQLKITLAKFYRITGSSNQRIGILPDIQLPSPHDTNEFGEASRPNALPWDEIKNARFEPTNNINEELLDKLNQLYRNHINTDQDLKKLMADIEKNKQLRNENTISLNLEERRRQTENDSDDEADNDNMTTTIDNGEVNTTEHEKKLQRDPYLKEALKLLATITKEN